MKHWSFYRADTGELTGDRYSAPDESGLSQNTPPGCVAVEGRHDHISRRVDVATGQVISYQPPQPSPDHEWTGERWRLNPAAQDRARQRRAAQASIDALEAQQPRAARELLLKVAAALNVDGKRLQALDDQIANHRKRLT